jgi:hypothetical protein
VFISSILSNLKIKHKLRITKYKQDHFQHIYPIVPTTGGNYITVDCVVDRFNYEEPYSEKQDTTMELEYLNGVPSTNNVDVQDLMGWEELEGGDLGKLFKRKAASGGGGGGGGGGAKKGIFKKLSQPPGSDGGKKGGKLKNFIHKALHVTNRVNPATALIRSGVLISMKLNLFKVAQRLKFAYLTDEQARQKEVDMSKFDRLKKVKEKLEKIFYDAGGKPENLKKAILTGKGHKNHEVSGLGYIVDDMSGLDETSSMSDLLGTVVFYDEGFNGLVSVGDGAFWSKWIPRRGDIGLNPTEEEGGYTRDIRYFAGYTDVQRVGANQDFCRMIHVNGEPDNKFFACALGGTEGLSTVKYRTPSVKDGFEISRDDYMNDALGEGRDAYCRILKTGAETFEAKCNPAGEISFKSNMITDTNPPNNIKMLLNFYEGIVFWLRLRDDMVDYAKNLKVSTAGNMMIEEFPPNPPVTKGLEFNGIDQYLRIGDTKDLSFGDIVQLK